VCTSSREMRKSFERLAKLLPPGVTPVYQTRPFGDQVELAAKSRVPAMVRALACEHPEGRRGVATVAPCCSTQFHIGVPNMLSDPGMLFFNILNNSAPHARLKVIDFYKVKGAEGHLAIWKGWANKDRLPAPRWFHSAGDMRQFIRGIPKLLTKRKVEGGEDEWVQVYREMSRLTDPESIGTIWWEARPRFWPDSKFDPYTVEWRCFPSLQPHQAVDLANELIQIKEAFDAYLPRMRRWNRESGSVAELYRHLSERSYLIPPEPLEDHRWWELFHK
ncbi:MAG: hypothetical protein JO019_00935, partial [Candidatus Kaiserbacteria bacterium]|nr:hypothetical protein [Candidatus Kaiserbacteria bacterium]